MTGELTFVFSRVPRRRRRVASRAAPFASRWVRMFSAHQRILGAGYNPNTRE